MTIVLLMGTTAAIKPADLRAAFEIDLAACWQLARSLHPQETPYTFALYGLEGIPQLHPHVLTEEGLTQVANSYIADGIYDTLEEARKALRYSIADSPYTTELENRFTHVDALVKPFEHSFEEEEGYALLAKAAMGAFTVLDKKGLFGRGEQREKLLLMIKTSLTAIDWSKPSVKRLNSNTAFKRFQAESKMKGNYTSADALAVSRDGESLFYAGSRESKPGGHQIVDCNVIETRLKRQWHFFFEARDIALAADGTLFATRAKLGKGTTVLLRLPQPDRKCRQELQLQGLPAGLAVCATTGRIAVSAHDNTVHLVTSNLEVTHASMLQSKATSFRFLRTGELLAATGQGIVSFDAQLKATPTGYRQDTAHISVDTAEKLCAASTEHNLRMVQKKPFGFDLLSVPKMEIIRKFQLDSHQLSTATLSPDGKLVACVATSCGTGQRVVIVYETETGREVGRKKTNSTSPRLAFLPGKDVLALTTCGNFKSEPVILWKIPKRS